MYVCRCIRIHERMLPPPGVHTYILTYVLTCLPACLPAWLLACSLPPSLTHLLTDVLTVLYLLTYSTLQHSTGKFNNLRLDGSIIHTDTCVHTYVHARTHTYMQAYMRTGIRACIHTAIRAYIHTCIHETWDMHAYMHTYTRRDDRPWQRAMCFCIYIVYVYGSFRK